MRTIRIFLGLLSATLASATAGTAAAEDVYTCPVEDVIGFRKMEEGVTADNRFGWAMDVDTMQPDDIVYQLIISDGGVVSVYVSTDGSEYMNLEEIYDFGIDTYQRGVLALSGGSDIEEGSTRFNFAFDVVEMTMMLHISSVYAADTPLNTSMYMYTAKCS